MRYLSSLLLEILNKTFLCLVPKVPNPTIALDFIKPSVYGLAESVWSLSG